MSKFPLNGKSYLFFPPGKALRLRLTKHCFVKKLVMYGSCAFDCDVEAQLVSGGVCYSVILWVYNFDHQFSAP